MARNKKFNKSKDKDFDEKEDPKFDKSKDRKSRNKSNNRGKKDYDNDPRWYATDPNLVADFAKLSFSNAVGYFNNITPATGTNPNIDYTGGLEGKYVTPGLMTLEMVPTIGTAFDNNAAVNKGAMDMITQIRSKLGSFTKIYNAPDVMKYILAVDSAQTFYYFLCRLYGIMNQYYNDNHYYPQVLIEANNVDFQSIVGQNANAFKGYIDKYANFVSKFPIPANLSILARHAWLYQSIYTDSDALKPQLYMFVPGQFLRYTETSGSNICLEYVDFGETYTSTKWTLSSLITLGDSLLNAIQTSEDLQYIAGDIRKAFGDDMMVPIYEIGDNYVVPQTHSYEILSQIENATAVGKNLVTYIAENYSSVDPTVSTALYYGGPTYHGVTLANNRITVASYVPVYAGEKILNFHTDNAPTGDDVMVATRLTAVARTETHQPDASDPSGLDYVGIITCGSEFVSAFHTYAYLAMSGGGVSLQHFNFRSNNYFGTPSTKDAIVMVWSAFDWAPQLNFVEPTSAGATDYFYTGIMLDVANYTILPTSKLEQIHDVALLSEFGVTQTTANKSSFSTDKYTDR